MANKRANIFKSYLIFFFIFSYWISKINALQRVVLVNFLMHFMGFKLQTPTAGRGILRRGGQSTWESKYSWNARVAQVLKMHLWKINQGRQRGQQRRASSPKLKLILCMTFYTFQQYLPWQPLQHSWTVFTFVSRSRQDIPAVFPFPCFFFFVLGVRHFMHS